jgi:zinc transport system substrate-binding protein
MISRFFSIAHRPLHKAGAVWMAVTLGLGSCAPVSEKKVSPTIADLQVATTFLPMTQFTKAVVGDRAEVVQLLPTTAAPHDYQASPEDVRKLADADVLVENGMELEEFLDDLVKNAANPQLRIIDSSKNVIPISNAAVEGKKSAHATAEHDHHGESNPHVWLDPKRAMQQVASIRDGMIAADPAGKNIYTANAAAYIQQLKELDAEFTKALQPYTGKTFVAFHDFAPYFAQSYNLTAQFLVDAPEENPSPDDVKRVIDTVKLTQLKTLLTEPQAGEEGFSGLANDLNIKVSTFDPMETGGAEAMEPSYYLATMRKNLQSLESAFAKQSAQSLLGRF